MGCSLVIHHRGWSRVRLAWLGLGREVGPVLGFPSRVMTWRKLHSIERVNEMQFVSEG